MSPNLGPRMTIDRKVVGGEGKISDVREGTMRGGISLALAAPALAF